MSTTMQQKQEIEQFGKMMMEKFITDYTESVALTRKLRKQINGHSTGVILTTLTGLLLNVCRNTDAPEQMVDRCCMALQDSKILLIAKPEKVQPNYVQ